MCYALNHYIVCIVVAVYNAVHNPKLILKRTLGVVFKGMGVRTTLEVCAQHNRRSTSVYNDRAWGLTVWDNNIIILELSFCISIHLSLCIYILYRLLCTLRTRIYIYIILYYIEFRRSNRQSTKSHARKCVVKYYIIIIVIVFVAIIREVILRWTEKTRARQRRRNDRRARVHIYIYIYIYINTV